MAFFVCKMLFSSNLDRTEVNPMRYLSIKIPHGQTRASELCMNEWQKEIILDQI